MSEEKAWYSAFHGSWGVRPELTRRELEVLRLMADGHTRRSAAAELCLGLGTVKIHLESLKKKTRTHTTAQTVAYAMRAGWIS